MLAKYVRPMLSSGVGAIVRWLHGIGVTPNMVSFAGFVLTIGAATLLATGSLRIGGGVLWVAAMFDMVDGALARLGQSESKFGAFLDSTLDRYSESITFLGLAVFFANQNNAQTPLLLIFLTLVGSWAVSYTRARAEGLDVECKAGILQRPERLVLLIAGLILGLVLPVLWLLAVMTNFTAVQRIYEVYVRTSTSRSKQHASN
ncbi:MAG: CDP-alcohol phosphatidyltransferase family protein [Caldilineaceae bacterium SB0675_bin_29]|uniref:CDP-alcohol phosphatidyltransferase family protein n=1 Tax=Caldilineaceae bacterium SB0675_bin_29 TaxID=2605266 RepID=A0A6B1G2L0_9CHLR|nr:CDP-alcohol phosphatidyltransferase family protein [Caldilineaceae bacterium SB0675_bin_29]